MRESNLHSILFYEVPLKTSLRRKILYILLFGAIIVSIHQVLLFRFGPAKEVGGFLSVYVGIVCATTLGVLWIATNDLRDFYCNLTALLKDSNYNSSEKYNILKKPVFLIICGIGIGLLIVLFAYEFGVWYESSVVKVSMFIQFFILGFFCGLAWRAAYWILDVVQSLIVNNNLKLDYFNPDSCAGTSIIGNILYKFAAYSLLIGSLILLYVWMAPWTNIDLSKDFSSHGFFVICALVLPFIVTLIIFFYPMFRIHEVLKKYKSEEHMKMRESLNILTQEIIKFNPATGSSQELERYKDKYEQMMKIEDFLKTINTWPFRTKAETISNTFVVITPVLLGMANFIYSALHAKK